MRAVICLVVMWGLTACSGDADGSREEGAGTAGQDGGGGAGGGRAPTPGVTPITGGQVPSGMQTPQAPTVPVTPEGAGEIASLRLEPDTATLDVLLGEEASQAFKVFATFEDEAGEREVTDRAVFYVPENYRLGSFPDDANTFVSNTQEPLGGVATIAARLLNPDGSVLEVTGRLVIRVTATLDDPRSGDQYQVPDGAADLFEGQEPVTDNAPSLVYPNDGTLLPPNLSRFAVHFMPAGHALFKLSFSGTNVALSYFLRCGDSVDGGCIFELDEAGYRLLAESSRGDAPLTVDLLGTDDAGAAIAKAEPIHIQFSNTDVTGGLYYWSTTDPVSIMRVQFDATTMAPEPFLEDQRDVNGCPGCHAISPDGRRVVASLLGQYSGNQVLVNDLSEPATSPTFVDRDGSQPEDVSNRLQFASFNADGSEFVSIYGDTDDLTERHTLWFHDGQSGSRIAGRELQLPFEPSHPDWAADGDTILMTEVGIHQTSQRPLDCGIAMVTRDGQGWNTPQAVIPVVNGDGKSRYNPDFAPDDSFFVFSESICPDGNEQSDACDADADPTAKTWAAPPVPDATPLLLARAAAPGIMDAGETNLSDTFPRAAPFATEYLGPEQALDGPVVPRRAFWITVGSVRRVGLLNGERRRQLWMFAVDPDRVLAGEDGSFPAFHLPIQDLATDNHIGQWTREVVTDDPPPEPPMPEPPAIPEPVVPL